MGRLPFQRSGLKGGFRPPEPIRLPMPMTEEGQTLPKLGDPDERRLRVDLSRSIVVWRTAGIG